MAKKRATISISLEAKSQLDNLKSEGQSYGEIIQELVKFWKEKKNEYWTRRRRQREIERKKR